MPDSQNKQGEQKSSKCARCGIEYFDDNSPTALCGYCEADRRNALRRQGIDPDAPHQQGEQSDTPRTDATFIYEMLGVGSPLVPIEFARQLERELSLLSQQHAPSKVEERLHEIAKKWYDKLEYGSGVDVWGMLISALTELATELTKGLEAERVKYEAQLKAIKEDRDAILDDRDSLRQQLAEANEWVLLFEKLSVERGREIETIRAQNIALSAVVEKMKRGLESIVHECGINPAGEYYIIAHAATQLLADLGHK